MGMSRVLKFGQALIHRYQNGSQECEEKSQNIDQAEVTLGQNPVSDQRKFFRLKALLDGTFKSEDGAEGVMMLTDFSRDGLKASLNKKVAAGKQIAMEIWFPGKVATLTATGRVVWMRKNQKNWSGKFDAGLQFERISYDDRWRILDYAYEYWRQSRVK